MSSQQALNRAVSAAADVQALQTILSTARDEDVNAINCAAIAGKAAKIHAGRWTTESERRACEETVKTIADRAARALRETPREWWPRQCSAMLWACGKVGRRHEGLERAVSGMIEARGGSAKPQELSNAMWGLAKVGSDAHELYAYLGDRVRVSLQVDKGTDHRTGWTSQGVSNAAWSLGSMREAAAKAMFEESALGREVVDGLANAVEERANLFNPQECANTMWAFAKCSAYVPEESERGAKALVGRIKRERGWMSRGEFQCQHVSNVIWACAKLNMGDDTELVEILVETAREYANKFNAQELSMILWAFATMQAQDEKIMHALAKAMARKVEESNAQQMATAAHAMAKVGVYNSQLMKAYKESAPTRGDEFQSRDVAFLAWAYAKLNVRASEIFDAFREKMQDAGFVDTFTPHHLTMVLWSFAMLSERTDDALQVMTERIKTLVDSFNPRDLTNTAWALAALGCQDELLIRALGTRARNALSEFNSQELLKFLGAYERLGVNDDALAEAVSAQRTLSYDFPALGSSVSLTAETPQSYEGTDRVRVDDSCGGWGRGNTGVALWEGSFVLAEWLSRQKTPLSTEGIEKALAGAWGERASWDGKVGVELGAGLGLPSIIASKLGVTMIATDGDDNVLGLLKENVDANASSDSRVEKLVWGATNPLKALGLKSHPDLVMASDVVYGNNPAKWTNLVQTMRDLAGPNTLVLIANVQRYPIHHPLAETKFYTEATAEYFVRSELPVTALHSDFQRTGAGNCVIHIFRASGDKKRKSSSSQDNAEEKKPKKEKKEEKEKKEKKEKKVKKEKKEKKKEKKSRKD